VLDALFTKMQTILSARCGPSNRRRADAGSQLRQIEPRPALMYAGRWKRQNESIWTGRAAPTGKRRMAQERPQGFCGI